MTVRKARKRLLEGTGNILKYFEMCQRESELGVFYPDGRTSIGDGWSFVPAQETRSYYRFLLDRYDGFNPGLEIRFYCDERGDGFNGFEWHGSDFRFPSITMRIDRDHDKGILNELWKSFLRYGMPALTPSAPATS